MIGNYSWQAVLRDGMVIHQMDPTSITGEISIDVLQDEDVAEIRMIPRREGFPFIRFMIRPGESWRKYWIRTFTVFGSVKTEFPVIDVLGLRSEFPVRLFVLPDGSLTLSTYAEPEGPLPR